MDYEIINELQGTSAWLIARKSCLTASEAPAALGKSKYISRSKLLAQKSIGIVEKVNFATQALFNKGHETENLARKFAEDLIGEELYPITAKLTIQGLPLLASLDGITMDNSIIFEHKLLSKQLIEQINFGLLDEHYSIQLDQQLLVTGAKKVLFVTSDGTRDNFHSMWYEPKQENFDRLIAAWQQFKIDLDTYVPTVSIEAPKAQPVLALPALFIHAKGEITTSNMKEYGEALAKRLEDVRAIALVTDQDFSNAKEAAKLLRDNIKQANLAKEAMLSQTVTVGEAARMIDTWCEDMRLTALQLEKDVTREDLVKKQAMIKVAQDSFTNLVNALEAGTAPIKLNIQMPNFADAIKGKSKYSAMQDAISTLVANSTVEANRVSMDIRDKQNWLNDRGFEFLFADIQIIIFKPIDDFKLLVQSRIDNHKKSEAERDAKIIAEANAAALEKVRLADLAKENAATNVEQVKSVVTTGLGVSVASVNNDGNIITSAISIMHFQGVEPSVNDLVNAVAKAFGADAMMAHKWLLEADFTKYQQAA